MAMMNMMPPMVGVPCLDMCQVGPSVRMAWPAFSRCSSGISSWPAMAATPKAIIKLRMYVMAGTLPVFLF